MRDDVKLEAEARYFSSTAITCGKMFVLQIQITVLILLRERVMVFFVRIRVMLLQRNKKLLKILAAMVRGENKRDIRRR